MGTAKGWLNVQSNESMKEVIGQHSYEPKSLNSGGGMFIDMIGMPIGEKDFLNSKELYAPFKDIYRYSYS